MRLRCYQETRPQALTPPPKGRRNMSWSNVLRDQRQNLALISSWASQVRLGKVRDLIRKAEYEIEQEEKRVEEMEDKRQPWVRRLEIFARSKGKWWVRWTGADGRYRWLHPDTNLWIEEPHQIKMPMFKGELLAAMAAEKSPMPPTWEEYARQRSPAGKDR